MSLLTLAGSIVFMYPVFLGVEEATSFSVCEQPEDGAGEPRLECQASDLRFQGGAGSNFGFSVAAGRLNGDEMADIVVGDPARGRVYIFYGRTSTTAAYGLLESALDRGLDPATRADVILDAGGSGVGSFGFSVAVGSPTSATGCGADKEAAALLVGAPGDPGTTGNAPGSAFYFPPGSLCLTPSNPASPTSLDPATTGQIVPSPAAADDDEFGYSVALGHLLTPSAGDEEDLIVGARGAAGGDGRVFLLPVAAGQVVLDPASGVTLETLAGDGLGEVLAVGDLDQDFDETLVPFGNRDDLAIGAVGNANGKVLLVRGPLAVDGSDDGDGVYTEGDDVELQAILGEEPADYFGFSLAISDRGDLAVGAIFADNHPPGSGADSTTNVGGSIRQNTGKVYLWFPGLYDGSTPNSDSGLADVVLVGRRAGDHLGFALAFGDVDGSGDDDLVATARREDGSGLTVNEIDQGTAYVILDQDTLSSPLDLGGCESTSNCTGVTGADVLVFGGDRENNQGDEMGFALTLANVNGDGSDDLIVSSATHHRVYVVTLEDTDGDRETAGRNIRDDDDDADGDPDSTDCQPIDPDVFTGADEITCNGIDDDCNGIANDTPDEDDDGFDICGDSTARPVVAPDCNDHDPHSYPGAPELCDGNDNDCNGAVPSGESDVDGDHYVDCTGWNDTQGDQPTILGSGDCDRLTAATFPGAAPNEANPMACRKDSDGDDWGDSNPPVTVTPGTDCDDGSIFVFPGAAELQSPTACMRDVDGDGYGSSSASGRVTPGSDCADTDAATHPGAPEICDGNDNVCDGSVPTDELDTDGDGYVACNGWDDVQGDDAEILGGGDCGATDPLTAPGAAENESVPEQCRRDADGDGFGDLTPPAGVSPGTDCDDASAVTFPGAAPLDAPLNCMKDADDDDYGDDNVALPVVKGTDCDDDDILTFTGATEIPDDGIDQDCNTFDTVTCFRDVDRDGIGGASVLLSADGDCTDPGESLENTDCDDNDASVFPGQPEIPGDGLDQDCNGVDAVTCFVDQDRDGFGSSLGTTVLAPDGTCDASDGESVNTDDCDDSDGTTFPGAPQRCDGNDNTCGGVVPANEQDADGDGRVACTGWNDSQADQPGIIGGGDCDESSSSTYPGAGFREPFASACMLDADGDGFGSATPPPGVVRGSDCDDSPTGASTFPGAAALDGPLNCMKDADGDDYGDASVSLPVVKGTDCDDSSATAAVTFPGAAVHEPVFACHKDEDGDGFGDATPPPGVSAGTDCDDISPAAATTFPGAAEVCDGDDNDCDGVLPADEADGDGDGWVACVGWSDTQGNDPGVLGGGDCDGASPTTFPGAAPNEASPELCRADADGDGFGDPSPAPGVSPGSDCDDGAADTFPGAAPLDAPSGCMKDSDGDDYGDSMAGAPVDAGTDCDDADPQAFPGAPELPNDGVDQNCDGGDSTTCFEDLDGDGFGTSTTLPALDMDCTDPGESPFDTDCDDVNGAIFPGAVETPLDGIDQDCNGFDGVSCFVDSDGDGFGGTIVTVSADDDCLDPGESSASSDCNDALSTVFPGADETPDDGVDQDCNGFDAITCFIDGDNDGFGNAAAATVVADDGTCDPAQGEASTSDDCNDANATIRPGAVETPDDGVDQDCSGSDTISCIVDADGDGFGTSAGTIVLAADGTCDTAQGESTTSNDCDDSAPGVFPGAAEIPGDGIDQDCSGADSLDCFRDADGDGYGTTATIMTTDGDCADPGESPFSTDCNDANGNIHPGTTDIADDGIDQDCNGADTITCVVDADGDGFGTILGTPVLAPDGSCDANEGESTVATDCNDASADQFPGNGEIVDDGIDQNCSGADSITCFVDADHDGFGTVAGTTVVAADGSCDTAQGESSTATDCDDTNPNRSPAAFDIPGDGIDQDCDGVDSHECFLDADGDGFGGTGTVTSADADCSDTGESSVSTDCNDADPDVFPGALDVPDDGMDQNCNGADTVTCIVDFDRDGYGTSLGTTVLAPDGHCDSAQRESTNSADCDDTRALTFPGGIEIPDDGLDQDCSGADTVTCVVDADGDGFGTTAGTAILAPDGSCDTVDGESGTDDDCNDADASIFPGAPELPLDGIDQDCNGSDATTCFQDLDGDGFGTTTTIPPGDMDCNDPGESPFSTDCDDDDAGVSPSTAEVPDDGIDQDCSGADTVTCFVDADHDGSGNLAGVTLLAADGKCDADQGESATSGDCDESDPNTFPTAIERCDGNDNTCSGAVPANETDPDADGFVACLGWNDTQGDQPGILGGGDCGPADPLTFPGAAPKENLGAACMRDHDGDDYGDLAAPAGVTRGTDCNDNAADTYPGAAPLDHPQVCMKDSDGDDYGDKKAVLPVVAGTDCDDANALTRPGAVERCDGNDNSCDGIIPANERDLDGDLYVACLPWDDVQGDNPTILGGGDCAPQNGGAFPGAAPNEAVADACLQDLDGDDWGDQTPPAGVLAGSDCDDDDGDTFPGAAPLDHPTACMRDRDGDDFGDASAALPIVPGSDCDDGDGARFPGAVEFCGDMIDSDCDGQDPICVPSSLVVAWTDGNTLSWSPSTDAGATVSIYRGDLGQLRSTGEYTQEPGVDPAADRFCGMTTETMADGFVPALGKSAFYLAAAMTPSGESGLGFDSEGRLRANTRPCP